MLTLTESGWLLDGQPTTLASWLPNSRIATLNSNITSPIAITISDLVFLGNDFTVSGDSTQGGLLLSAPTNISIMNMTFDGFGTSLNISSGNNVSFINVGIQNSSTGAFMANSTLCSFTFCVFENNEFVALNMVNCSDLNIIGSVFNSNTIAAISATTCVLCKLVDNQFINNGGGVAFFTLSNNNGIVGNQFMGQQGSIMFADRSSFNDVSENEFIDDAALSISLFQNANDNEIYCNTFTNANNGVALSFLSNNNAILNNEINVIEDGVVNDNSNGTQIISNIISTVNGQGIDIISGENLDIRDNIITVESSSPSTQALSNPPLPFSMLLSNPPCSR